MEISECTPLLETKKGLNLIFSIICIVDVFGVFPVIALPKAIIDCGLSGILVIFIVCLIQIYTAILLGRCWIMAEKIKPVITKKNRYPYSALAELTYGKYLGRFVTFLVDVTIFGGGIPNLIVASQNLQILGNRVSDGAFNLSFCYWMIITGVILCPVLWLGSPKDMKLICALSVGIVTTVFLLLCCCLLFSSPKNNNNNNSGNDFLPPASMWELLFTTYGIIAFQFDIHPTILTIQIDMQDKTKLGKAVLGGFGVSLAMFTITTIIAGVNYGNTVKSSILDTLPTTIPLELAALLIALQLGLTSALSNSALYQDVEDCMGISRNFNHRRCVLRTGLTLFAILIAESVPRFDLVMSMIGGTLTGPLVFILPPLIYMKMVKLLEKHENETMMESFTNIVYGAEDRARFVANYLDDKLDKEVTTMVINNNKKLWWNRIECFFCCGIILISLGTTGYTTYINVKNANDFISFSTPCIYNVSQALINS